MHCVSKYALSLKPTVQLTILIIITRFERQTVDCFAAGPGRENKDRRGSGTVGWTGEVNCVVTGLPVGYGRPWICR